MNYKLLKDWDYGDMAEAVIAIEEYCKSMARTEHAYSHLLSIEFAKTSLLERRVPAVIVGQYLVLYVGAELWFSPKKVFAEVMLTKLPSRPDSALDDVPAVMELIARENGWSAIVVGNGNLRPGLTRFYQKHGFQITNTEHIKELV